MTKNGKKDSAGRSMGRALRSKRWTHPFRNNLITKTGMFFLTPVIRLLFGVQIKKCREKRQCLILYNHQTSFDQFFIAMTFMRAIYYIATEDIFSNGIFSGIMKWALDPIPIDKTSADIRAMINSLRAVSEGGSIALAPEGNRTYSGETCSIKPSVVSFVRKLGLPVVFFRIENGYGVQPRWSDVNRKGRMSAGISRVMEPAEYASLSDDELYELIKKELYVSEACPGGPFVHKRSAEYIERLFYVCPECGLSSFESSGSTFRCLKCGLSAEYTPTREIRGEGFPFKFAARWYDYQEKYIREADMSRFIEKEAYNDTVRLFRVEVSKSKKQVAKKAVLHLYGDRIEIEKENGDLIIGFDSVRAVTVLGRNKMNIRLFDKTVYQIKGSKRFNAVKYINFYYKYVGEAGSKTSGGGKINAEFLGF